MGSILNKILNGENVRSVILESTSAVKVTEINSADTGGGVKTYYGKLSNGQYFVFGLGTIMLCDADYAEVFTPEFYEKTDGDTYEWEKEHKVAEYFDPESVPENKKDLIKSIIAGSFEKLGKSVDNDFVPYLN